MLMRQRSAWFSETLCTRRVWSYPSRVRRWSTQGPKQPRPNRRPDPCQCRSRTAAEDGTSHHKCQHFLCDTGRVILARKPTTFKSKQVSQSNVFQTLYRTLRRQCRHRLCPMRPRQFWLSFPSWSVVRTETCSHVLEEDCVWHDNQIEFLSSF